MLLLEVDGGCEDEEMDVDEGGGDDVLAFEDEGLAEEDASEPSVLNMTMLAVWPEGTVTTQKLAPPSPVVASGLSTSLMPMLEGSILHGVPLHPPPGHSMLSPNVGFVVPREEPV